ncbi:MULTISPECIES: RidA family protein [unclassified Paenibacillus]|uniref:RidA family protein n=1 Tax=unclassified Paenibacillus TaxID=185978 RepID=UPI002405C687|nr:MULTISPECIES: RidA family protein [unclassified Paenibacillus]MDF9845369.1 2-iminobutanoate/2-iminopropanoate deaminase [Paenibacillus sp. PastF-2]MDF9851945.1 2-iminobutanoate/2-iminopropanoate deaminase [Paenibacillus sp. PastM-2]MDF9858509.1 2-iminobutanoate/2-iminopropanoate deaminase [Paenibacillus sp. PastF-1]MDH6483782.1 2-iminobutanoate/2-iminopropanoate deaminase [Paenibacillus sp. PastH-2]MDH6511157.1 2-iminobutanoate/2-iminopropanoate deaminase [Paenibacillus sp. PastM-3]
MEKVRIMPENHWNWSMPVPFSQGWKVGNLIFVGGQISADENSNTIGVGDIEVQTRNCFENIRKVLNEVGADMKDIVKLNTYYVFEGDESEATDFWEKMTKVRMEYIKEPGPVGTAIRISGFAFKDLLIEVEAIAVVGDSE